MWVEGEPGIGKSALVAAGLAEARQRGCAVFAGRADDVVRGFPLQVWLDCLGVRPGAADPARAQITGLLYGAGTSGAVTPGQSAVAAAAELLVELVQRCCMDSPVVLMIDDLQWADEMSLVVWHRLRRVTNQLPLLLIGVCRPVPKRGQIDALRASVTGNGGMPVNLGPLGDPHVAELVKDLVGAAPGPRLVALAGQASGNPLYVRELVDASLREQRVRVRARVADLVEVSDRGAGPPVSLAAAIAGRLGFLSEPAVEALRMAALLGTDFAVSNLSVVTGRAATLLVPVVDEALSAGVLVESADRLAFRHGLIRQALYQAIPALQRAALHQQAAQALAAAGALVEHVAEQLLAAPKTFDAWVTAWIVEAAPKLIHRAPQIAVKLLAEVREAAAPDDPRRERLDAEMAAALLLLGRHEEVEPLAVSALARTSDPEMAGRLTWTMGYALLRMVRYDQALKVIRVTLVGKELTGVWVARLRALEAMVLGGSGRAEESAVVAAQAEEEGRRADDRLAVGYALHTIALWEGRHGADMAGAGRTLDRALDVLGDSPEVSDLRLMLLGNRAAVVGSLGRFAEADRALGEALALAERSGSPPRLVQMRLQDAELFFHIGRWDDALAEMDAAAELRHYVPPRRLVWLHGLWAMIAFHRDDEAALERHLQVLEDLAANAGDGRYPARYLLVPRALAAQRSHPPGEALAQLRAVLDPASTGEYRRVPYSHLWLPDVVRLALAVGDHATALAATEACAELARKELLPETGVLAQHCRGQVNADPAMILDAAQALHRIGLPLHQAQALENAAVLFAEAGALPAARTAYADCLAIYTRLDAAWNVKRAYNRLSRLGIRRVARRRPTVGWKALTPTELKVADLITTGRSNPDIAAQLCLSRRTVETHVSNILAKLGARSRVDIAREAARQGTQASPSAHAPRWKVPQVP